MSLHTCCQRFLFGTIAFSARFFSCISDMYSVTSYFLSKVSLWYSSILHQVFLVYLWYIQCHSIHFVEGFSLICQHSIPEPGFLLNLKIGKGAWWKTGEQVCEIYLKTLFFHCYLLFSLKFGFIVFFAEQHQLINNFSTEAAHPSASLR